jgi:AcrR family transcriptional regulator
MAQDTRDKAADLVDAALEVFARAGLEGARVDAIAQAARMNKRLLYHYVGDKTALFDAAALAAVGRLLAAATPGDDPVAWRVLCHASAVGRCPDLTALAARLAGTNASVLGRQLLAGLLPELAGALPEPAPAHVAPGLPKPRIKLRPDLSPAR